jgi:hypothetical protein
MREAGTELAQAEAGHSFSLVLDGNGRYYYIREPSERSQRAVREPLESR